MKRNINNRIIKRLKQVVEKPEKIEGIESTSDLLETGILASLEVAGLIPALEEEFSINEIDIEDIVPENFSSVNRISQLIERYLEYEC